MGLAIDQCRELLKIAYEQTKRSYAPYSGFCVGAALLAKNGQIFCGCNVENVSFGAGICAERNALFSAVGQGILEFAAIAVIGGRKNGSGSIHIENDCYPCGICLQALHEFCGQEFQVILADSEDADEARIKRLKLKELLPYGFGMGSENEK